MERYLKTPKVLAHGSRLTETRVIVDLVYRRIGLAPKNMHGPRPRHCLWAGQSMSRSVVKTHKDMVSDLAIPTVDTTNKAH